MKLKINDYDGFIAIVNVANYYGFVDEDWQLDQLMTHFADQMQIGNIVVWQTNNQGGGNWLISFQEQPSTTHAFREFDQFINVTSGDLFLANYSDLTMAAQFSDVAIPEAHNRHLRIELKNGFYRLTVRQLFDPDNCQQDFNEETDENISFEIIVTPSDTFTKQLNNSVHWLKL